MYNGYFITLILDWLEENYYKKDGGKNWILICKDCKKKRYEDKIGCGFIRVSDEETHFYNVGYVIKEIFKIN